MIGLPLLLLLLLLFWLLPPSTAKKIQTMCVLPKQLKFRFQSEFYRPGDLIIGGNLPLEAFVNSNVPDFREVPPLIADEVLLPNITLGFHIYDNHKFERRIFLLSLSLLSTRDIYFGDPNTPSKMMVDECLSTAKLESRSATICLAYLMRTNRVKLDEAFEFVKQRRSIISPNFSFMGQLLQFESQVLAPNCSAELEAQLCLHWTEEHPLQLSSFPVSIPVHPSSNALNYLQSPITTSPSC
ncbi:putative Dual specificity protein [Naja naja]|nr:putative Dual specificity protein [Naja naja]